MEQSKFCRICLVSDVKMYLLDLKCGDSLGFIYSQFTGIQIRNISHYVCYECGALLKKFHLFKLKCLRAHRLLSKISRNPTSVTKELVDIHIDREKNELISNLVKSETLCFEPTKNLTNVCPIIHDGLLKKVDDKLEIEIKPGILFSNDYGEDITQSEEFNEEFVKKELPNLYKDKLQNEDYDYQNTETQSMLEVFKTSSGDFNNDSVEYLDENILAEVEESVVTEYLEEHMPAEAKDSVDTSKSEVISEKPKKKRQRKNTSQKDSDTKKIKKQLNQSLYKMNDNSVDWNLEFKGFGRVEMLTREEAKNEVLKRKESTNYNLLPYKCQYCFRGFERQYTFDNHMKLHKEETGKYECEFCHVRFSKSIYKRGHELHTHLRKFYCLLCPYTTFSTDRGRSHMLHHQGKTYPCTECDEVFSLQNSMIMHKRLKHFKKAGTEVVCELCGNIFTTVSGRNMHYNRIHKSDKNSYQGPKCEECGIHFDSEKAWSRHLVLSSKHAQTPDGYICKHCGERFSNEYELKTHTQEAHIRRQLIKHPRKTPINCRSCGLKLNNMNEYAKHRRKEHRKNTCTLTEHDKKCEVKRVQNKPSYRDVVKPFMCEVCGLAFQCESQLREHQTTHTGERPYQCDICNKRYKTKLVLYMHKKIHQSYRHICDYCGKRFVLKNKLSRHILSHMGLKRHKCLTCNKTFPYNCELKQHVKYVHENVPWPKRIRRKRNVPKDGIVVTNEAYDLNNWYL